MGAPHNPQRGGYASTQKVYICQRCQKSYRGFGYFSHLRGAKCEVAINNKSKQQGSDISKKQ